MKKIIKISLLGIMLIVSIYIVWFIIVPSVKFQSNYEVPNNLSEQQTIEEFFECLNNKNPGAANKLLINPMLDKYCCNNITRISLKEIKALQKVDINLNNYYDSSEYFVTFDCDYLFGIPQNQIFMSNCTNFYLIKEKEDSDWRIYGWGLG